jgi:hypothetical protein
LDNGAIGETGDLNLREGEGADGGERGARDEDGGDQPEEQADAKASASFHGGWIIDIHIVIIFTNLAGILIGPKEAGGADRLAAANSL